jgi:hypothetical protein
MSLTHKNTSHLWSTKLFQPLFRSESPYTLKVLVKHDTHTYGKIIDRQRDVIVNYDYFEAKFEKVEKALTNNMQLQYSLTLKTGQ